MIGGKQCTLAVIRVVVCCDVLNLVTGLPELQGQGCWGRGGGWGIDRWVSIDWRKTKCTVARLSGWL